MKFNELGIDSQILKALEKENYVQPTPIQEQAIPAALKGRDVLGLAQTGTGKTAAFAIPTMQRLSQRPAVKGKRPIRSLILTPTRELAVQIKDSFEAYGRHMPLRTLVIFGGVAQGPQVNGLRAGVDILVATPGRLDDLMKQKHVDLSFVEIFILDEADRMLDMGFIQDVKRIIKKLPAKKQTLLFSATMPEEITAIVDGLLVDPVKISLTPVSSAVDTVQQHVYYVDRKNKIRLLEDILKKHEKSSVLVFTRTKRGADRVVTDLAKRGIRAQAIHGNKSQTARQNALNNFKNNQTHVLIATDIAARGIDIDELQLVVNYELPDVPETYVHRIGRTGRAGFKGIAISLCSFEEIVLLKDIEALIKKKVNVIENTAYPLVDKNVSESKISKKKKSRLAALDQEANKGKPKSGKQNQARAKEQGNAKARPGSEQQKKQVRSSNGRPDWNRRKPKNSKNIKAK